MPRMRGISISVSRTTSKSSTYATLWWKLRFRISVPGTIKSTAYATLRWKLRFRISVPRTIKSTTYATLWWKLQFSISFTWTIKTSTCPSLFRKRRLLGFYSQSWTSTEVNSNDDNQNLIKKRLYKISKWVNNSDRPPPPPFCCGETESTVLDQYFVPPPR